MLARLAFQQTEERLAVDIWLPRKTGHLAYRRIQVDQLHQLIGGLVGGDAGAGDKERNMDGRFVGYRLLE